MLALNNIFDRIIFFNILMRYTGFNVHTRLCYLLCFRVVHLVLFPYFQHQYHKSNHEHDAKYKLNRMRRKKSVPTGENRRTKTDDDQELSSVPIRIINTQRI